VTISEAQATMIDKGRIREYAATIGNKFHPERVILFGSYARTAAATEDSDVDLLVVMEHGKARNIEQAIAIRLDTDAPFPVDLLVRRPAEVTERLASNDTFLRDVVENGEVLYG
jgi:predicted nucleotidyltransferase